MIELNLLPDLKKEFIRAQRTRNTVVSGAIMVSLAAGGAVLLFATVVYGGQAQWISNLNNEITNHHRELENKDEINKYLAIQSQLESLSTTSANRAEYGLLLRYLPQLNPAPPFNITLFDADLMTETSTLTLSGAANNFESVNNFRYTLEQAQLITGVEGQDNIVMFTDVQSSPPTLATQDGVTKALFTFTLIYAPEIFAESLNDPKVEVPRLTTSDSDQNAPRQLFESPPPEEDRESSDGQ